MPIYRKGDMFAAPGIHIVTAASSLSQDGTLIMGLGAALAMKQRHPDAPEIFGAMIQGYCADCGVYGLMLYGGMGILQTRRHYNDKTDPDLIQYGLRILRTIAEGQSQIMYQLIHPGLGYDKSTLPEIEQSLSTLPTNVTIWQR